MSDAPVVKLSDYAVEKAFRNGVENQWLRKHANFNGSGKDGISLTELGEIEFVRMIDSYANQDNYKKIIEKNYVSYDQFLQAMCLNYILDAGHPVIAFIVLKYFTNADPKSVQLYVLERLEERHENV